MEKRRDERFESDFTIELDGGGATLRNVSASGVYLVTDVDLAVGEHIRFVIRFSGLQDGLITAHCEARVVRIEPLGAQNGVGAELESIQFHRAP